MPLKQSDSFGWAHREQPESLLGRNQHHILTLLLKPAKGGALTLSSRALWVGQTYYRGHMSLAQDNSEFTEFPHEHELNYTRQLNLCRAINVLWVESAKEMNVCPFLEFFQYSGILRTVQHIEWKAYASRKILFWKTLWSQTTVEITDIFSINIRKECISVFSTLFPCACSIYLTTCVA